MPLSVGIGVGLNTLLQSGGQDWPDTPAVEWLVQGAGGLWEPYLVVQPDLTGWQMYEVEPA